MKLSKKLLKTSACVMFICCSLEKYSVEIDRGISVGDVTHETALADKGFGHAASSLSKVWRALVPGDPRIDPVKGLQIHFQNNRNVKFIHGYEWLVNVKWKYDKKNMLLTLYNIDLSGNLHFLSMQAKDAPVTRIARIVSFSGEQKQIVYRFTDKTKAIPLFGYTYFSQKIHGDIPLN